MAAADEAELKHMVATAAAFDEGPISFRYPRGEGVGVELSERGQLLEIGRGRVVREGTKIALLSFGTRLAECLEAAEELDSAGLSATVADGRFAKPLDVDLIERLAKNHEVLITVEEGSIGGFGSHVANHLLNNGKLDGRLKFRSIFLPDAYVDHGSPEKMYSDNGLDGGSIVQTVFSMLGKQRVELRDIGA